MRSLLAALCLVAAASARPLRVLSWNVHGGAGGLSQVAEVIEQSGADLVILQEVPERPRLEQHFPGRFGARSGKLLILSRDRIEEQKAFPLEGGRSCLWVRTYQLNVVDVHFSTAIPGQSLSRSGGKTLEYLAQAARVRHLQTEALLTLLKPLKGQVVVAGDLNSTPLMEPPLRLGQYFQSAGLEPTFPAHRPQGRIDYIFVSPVLNSGRSGVVPTVASDHRPVWLDLNLAAAS